MVAVKGFEHALLAMPRLSLTSHEATPTVYASPNVRRFISRRCVAFLPLAPQEIKQEAQTHRLSVIVVLGLELDYGRPMSLKLTEITSPVLPSTNVWCCALRLQLTPAGPLTDVARSLFAGATGD